MKRVILLAVLMPYAAFGQICDNFESGVLNKWEQSIPARWSADTSGSLSGVFSLHHVFDNAEAGIDRAGISINNLHPSEGTTRWSFTVRHGYDPSSLNNWAVFLMSEKGPSDMSPDGGTRGFALGVNLTGSDDTLRLWKIIDNQITAIVQCPLNWQTDIGITGVVRIIAERSADGNWNISARLLSGDLTVTGSGHDDDLFVPLWTGIYYRYSSTRDRLFWFDDLLIEGVFYEDTEAPSLIQFWVTGRNSVGITLSESQAEGTMVPDNIMSDPDGVKPISVVKISELDYVIIFKERFINKSVNTLIISKLCDISGNCSERIVKEFTPVWADVGDVIISEIMADPEPVVSLPGKEYLELTNRTSFSINLKDWKISTLSQITTMPEYRMPPSGILIVCAAQDTGVFRKFGRVAGIKQFPSLTDRNGLICISDSAGVLIHGVDYSSGWYNDDLKSQGGWALEMKDTGFPFKFDENWTGSESVTGGTPGYVNSVSQYNPDDSFYGILNVFPDDSLNVRIRFSEPVFDFPVSIDKIRIGDIGISGVSNADPISREFILTLKEPLHRKEIYRLDLTEEVKDFAGNPMRYKEFYFGLPEPSRAGDIIFTEVLFNPFPGDPDYLEFYNRSDRVIDASRLKLVSVNDSNGERSEIIPVSEENRCILPAEYFAISTDVKKITKRYFSSDPEHLFQSAALPSMPDDKGHLILYNPELLEIDVLVYKEEMHFSLLSTYEGIALEKTDLQSGPEMAGFWHSATESSGWGTPGAPNSVFTDQTAITDRVILSSSKITVNSDGYEDFLTITFHLKGNGNVISATVFDESGNYIKKIAGNLYAGPEASLIWDGTADDGSLVCSGIYIILITLYDDTGKTAKWKKVCTVLR